MSLLRKDLLNKIDHLQTRADESKLDSILEQISNRVVRQVLEYAPIMDADNAERSGEVIRGFHNAWEYAMENPPITSDLAQLGKIAARVEPRICIPGTDSANFRQTSARLIGLDYSAPSDETRIRKDILDVLDSADKVGFHPVEEAIFLYFHLARIQPFDAGNKRTANVIMNTNLLREGYVPIIIPQRQEDLFKSYFEGALAGFNEDSSKSKKGSLGPYFAPGKLQRDFYEYLGKREEESLTRIVNEIDALKHYSISVKTKCPSAVYTLKRKIAGWFHRSKDGRPFKQKADARSGTIEVVGEIPYFTLQKILDESKNSGIFSYEIERK